MNVKLLITAASSLIAILTQPASAAVIDFSGSATDNSYREFSSFSSNGFAFTTEPSCSDCLLTWGKTNRNNADQNGATIASNRGHPIVIKREDGGLFDLASFWYANLSNDYGFKYTSYDAVITFVTMSGSTSQNFVVSQYGGFYALTLNKLNLLSVSISGPLQIDNVQIANSVVVPPSVPEPATWAMMIAGFALVGGAMRRRKFGSDRASRSRQA